MSIEDFDFSVLTQLGLIIVIIRQAYKMRNFFKKEAVEFVSSIVDSSNQNFNKMLKQQKGDMEEVIVSMKMYTEEVVAIHENHEELKKDHKELKEDVSELGNKVKTHQTLLDKIKENC